MKLSLKPVRKPRGGVSGALWRLSIGTDVVPHIYIYFQMYNRLLEIMKNGDAGIFPVYYSLKAVDEVDSVQRVGVETLFKFGPSP